MTHLPCPSLLRLTRRIAVAIFALLLATPRSSAATAKPNIVFILADDLGWSDVAFHQGTAPTPHLDKLARESVELTQHYVAATCSPTRSALMSGRYWSRFGILGPDNRRAFPFDTVTLPRALKTVGYETALTGKWHLGSKPEWGPNHFGFDHSYGSLAGGVGPYNHFYKVGEYSRTWHRNEVLITEEGHATDLIATEAVNWIAARREAPFFLYVPFTAVHLPLKEPQPWIDRVPSAITDEVGRHYAACVMHLDDAVGRIIAALEKAGKRENTLLVFTSDNGGSTSENADPKYPADAYPKGKIPGNNRPWRGQKADLYEGGIRVPTIVSWPARLKPGKINHPVHVVDWMPIFSGLAGYRAASDLKWDGEDLWPLISGAESTPVPRLLYWTTPSTSAVRDGDWKLIVSSGRAKQSAKVQLFNLLEDPHETTDLADQRPDRLAELQRKLADVAKADRDAIARD
jgi:arylsulfatase A-like enzyme